MKSMLSIGLAALMGVLPACAQTNGFTFMGGTDQDPPTSSHLAYPKDPTLCMLVLLATAAGGGIIIWLYVHGKGCCGGKRLILERNCHDGVWVPVMTNDVLEPTVLVTNKWQVFRQIINDPQWDCCKFRVKIEKIPTE